MNSTQLLGDKVVKHSHWLFLLFILTLTTLTWSTLMDMVSVWNQSDTYTHCFLILPISLYLIYERKNELKDLKSEFNMLGASFFIFASIFWFIFQIADIKLLAQLTFIFMIQMLVLSFFGWRKTRLIWFPLFFLYFSVPFGSELVPLLRDITAQFSTLALKLTGIPVYLDSRYISIPTGDFFVAEACSGINYLIATVTLGVIYSYYQYRSWVRRLIFLSLSLTVPIIANGIRAYGIIMIAHWSNNEYATGVDHIIYGWVWFAVVLAMLFFIGTFLKEKVTEKIVTSDYGNGFDRLIDRFHTKFHYVGLALCLGIFVLSYQQLHKNNENLNTKDNISFHLQAHNFKIINESELNGHYPEAEMQSYFEANLESSTYNIDLYQIISNRHAGIISSVNTAFDKKNWKELETKMIDGRKWMRVSSSSGKEVWLTIQHVLKDVYVDSEFGLLIESIRQAVTLRSGRSYAIVIYSNNDEQSLKTNVVNKIFDDIQQVLKN